MSLTKLCVSLQFVVAMRTHFDCLSCFDSLIVALLSWKVTIILQQLPYICRYEVLKNYDHVISQWPVIWI